MRGSVSIAFQTDKPLSAYGPLAKTVEDYGFAGVSVYNDMLYQPAWLPLLEIARHTTRRPDRSRSGQSVHLSPYQFRRQYRASG